MLTDVVPSCIYASVDLKDNMILTTSSRTIGLVGISGTVEAAERIAEQATEYINGPLRHRRDIGTAALLQKRIDHMKFLGADLPSARVPLVGIL